jgi:2-dehydropantoate 2-reductase
MLARAGHDVGFVARGATSAAIRAHGLRLRGQDGDELVPITRVADDAAALGPAELVLMAVKTWQVPELAPRLVPLVGPDTIVVPLQNGVESAGQLAASLGQERVVGGLCHMLSWVERPGEIRWIGSVPSVTVGPRHAGQAAAVERAAILLRSGGIHVVVTETIERALWAKLLFIAPLGAVGAVADAGAGAFRHEPAARTRLEATMHEIVAVAAARGVELAPDVVSSALRRIDSLPEDATASLQRDILAGRPSELHELIGAVVRLGRESGVATPVSAELYAALLPLEQQARALAN